MLNLSLTNIRKEKLINVTKVKNNIKVYFSNNLILVVEESDDSNTLPYYRQFEGKTVVSFLITENCIYIFFEDTTMLIILTNDSAYYLERKEAK